MHATRMSFLRISTATATLLALLAGGGCSTWHAGSAENRTPAAELHRNGLHPWEIADDDGTIVLPDIFYADPVQNEQIMPYATKQIAGHNLAQIDQLIYPTIGNPFLYTKSGSSKRFMSVLRLDSAMITQHAFTPDTLKTSLSFYLVRRDRRADNTDSTTPIAAQDGVYPITVEQIDSPSLDGAPADLKRRQTEQVSFSRDSLHAVPEGLYDLRMELKSQGALVTFESQFNAIRIFESVAPSHASYRILNITDVQTSLGLQGPGTIPHMREFKDYVHAHATDQFKDVAFITFNGDMHNGGSVEMLLPHSVAPNYGLEAEQIMGVLKELDFPIFLTAGNHDGYVSTGHTPVEGVIGVDPLMMSVVKNVTESPWEGFTVEAFQKYLQDTKSLQGGRHVDIFTGRFVRKQNAQNFKEGWKPVDPAARNMVLYDGQNQWRKTYGPLYHSWTFGDNYFISLNTFELRQHRRSGWGMYTVNYGGGLSNVQLTWFNSELNFATARDMDIVIMGHHDPRGGHNGKDYPFYFPQIDYRGMGESAINYVKGEIIEPKLCQLEPDWMKGDKMELACMHDGLQEWMRADPEFDCDEDLRLPDGRCDESKYAINATDIADPNSKKKRHPYYSGYDFLHKISKYDRARTLIFGHTHFHSLEVLRTGEELIDKKVKLDFSDNQKYAIMDVRNPIRSQSWFESMKNKLFGSPQDGTTKLLLANAGIFEEGNKRFVLDLEAAGNKFMNVIQPTSQKKDREVAIIRMSSAADLTSQFLFGTKSVMFGFTVFDVYPGNRPDYSSSQINGIEYWRNLKTGGPDFQQEGTTLTIDRQNRLGELIKVDGTDEYKPNPDNPVNKRFELHK